MPTQRLWGPTSGGDSLDAASWSGAIPPATKATGIGTFTAVPNNNDTILIDAVTNASGIQAKVYIWKDTLTGAANQVKRGVDIATCLQNLTEAINASPASNAGVTYGTGTTAHADLLGAANDSVDTITILSRRYGTTQNLIDITVPIDVGAAFSWDNATMTGALSLWAAGDEVQFTNANHSAMTSNLDWAELLLPNIELGKITRHQDNFSAIGSPGTPWSVIGSAAHIRIFQCAGTENIHFQCGTTDPWIWIQDGNFLSVITGKFDQVHIKNGVCQCSADFNGTAGALGADCTTTGSLARLELLDQTKNSPGKISCQSGFIETIRDLLLNQSIVVGNGHLTFTGRLSPTGSKGLIEVVGNGSLFVAPRAASANSTAMLLMSGTTSFAGSEFDIISNPLVIGPRAAFDRGPVVATGVGEIDLRKQFL